MELLGEIKEYAKALSIFELGVCSPAPDDALLTLLENEEKTCAFVTAKAAERANPAHLMPEAKSVLVCLFPYYIKDVKPTNLSRYAGVSDYHKVVREKLLKLSEFIASKEPDAKSMILCDTAPVVDRFLAYKAGLGFFGKNHMLINETLGSYFFIGSLLLSVDLPKNEPLERECMDCGACRKACPGGALSKDGSYDVDRCVSYLTQKKALTEEQKKILYSQNSVYGCDACQEVCPHNHNLTDTPIREFYEHRIDELDQNTLDNMSGRSFKKTYGAYPFSWCKKETILKNFH